MAKGKTLEESMEALDSVINRLEKEDTSLEASFKLYQEGMKLLKECNDSIDKVEKKIMILNSDKHSCEESHSSVSNESNTSTSVFK